MEPEHTKCSPQHPSSMGRAPYSPDPLEGRNVLKKILAVAAVTAATTLSLTGTALAHSGDDIITSGKGSILGGNQLVVDANVPVNVCGNAIAILGFANAGCWYSGAAVLH